MPTHGIQCSTVFAFQGAKIFNKIPNKVKSETSIVKFKTESKDFDFDF